MDRGHLIVWRVLSWKYLGGGIAGANIPFKRQYQYDDLVAEDRLPMACPKCGYSGGYLKLMQDRNIEYIKMEKQGTLQFVMDNNLRPKPRPGASRISAEKLNHKMEDYLDTTLPQV